MRRLSVDFGGGARRSRSRSPAIAGFGLRGRSTTTSRAGSRATVDLLRLRREAPASDAKVAKVTAHLRYACTNGEGGGPRPGSRASSRSTTTGSPGTLRRRPPTSSPAEAARAGSSTGSAASSDRSARPRARSTRRSGSARRRRAAASVVRCYTGEVDWKARRGADLEPGRIPMRQRAVHAAHGARREPRRSRARDPGERRAARRIVDNSYEGRAERDPTTYVGFDVVRSGGAKKVAQGHGARCATTASNGSSGDAARQGATAGSGSRTGRASPARCAASRCRSAPSTARGPPSSRIKYRVTGSSAGRARRRARIDATLRFAPSRCAGSRPGSLLHGRARLEGEARSRRSRHRHSPDG